MDVVGILVVRQDGRAIVVGEDAHLDIDLRDEEGVGARRHVVHRLALGEDVVFDRDHAAGDDRPVRGVEAIEFGQAFRQVAGAGEGEELP